MIVPHMRTSISGGRRRIGGPEVALVRHPCDLIRPLARIVAVARFPSQEVSVCQVASVSGWQAGDGVGGGSLSRPGGRRCLSRGSA